MSTLIYGQQSVAAAINEKAPIVKLYLAPGVNIKLAHNLPYELKSRQELDVLTNYANHQGLVAELATFQYHTWNQMLQDKPQMILMLDHIEDPQNLGAIIRTANAAGLTYLVMPSDRAASVTAAVFKVASGGLTNVKIVRTNSLLALVDKLKAANYWIYASALSPKALNYNEVKLNYPVVLIVGNEHRGVSPTLINKADALVQIPMLGTVQSLNVSVATGILLFNFIINQKE